MRLYEKTSFFSAKYIANLANSQMKCGPSGELICVQKMHMCDQTGSQLHSFPEAAKFLLGIHKLNILAEKIMENKKRGKLYGNRKHGG